MLTAITIKINSEDLSLLRARGTNISGTCRDFLNTLANSSTRADVDIHKARQRVEALRKITKEQVAKLTQEEANLTHLQQTQLKHDEQVRITQEEQELKQISCCLCSDVLTKNAPSRVLKYGPNTGRKICGGPSRGCFSRIMVERYDGGRKWWIDNNKKKEVKQ